MNLLLDADIVIDYVGRREPHYSASQQVIAAGFFGDARLWMPAQSAADAFYVLGRHVESAAIQRAFLKLFEVVTPVSLSPDELIRAARLQWADYEDCLVALSANKVNADYLVTRDEKGFARSSVPAIRPSDLLAVIKRERGLAYGEATLG